MDKRKLVRINAFALAFLMLGQAHAQSCEGRSFTLTFSEFAEGTAITSQYADKGVVFASGATIAPDGSNPTAPVLSGTPRYQGPITATFVAPGSPSSNAATTQLTFDAGYFDQIGSTQVTFRDINNASLGTFANTGLGIRTFTAPAGTHSFTIGNTSDAAGFAIDNLSYTVGSSALTIASPAKGNTFALTQNTRTRSPDISFAAGGSAASGQVHWTVTMEYDTDRARGLADLVSTINTNGTAARKMYYQSRGGRVRVTASAANDVQACPLEYFYVVGDAIPDNEITARLLALYVHGATPRLLTGIADKESTYRQFASRSKYDKQALWPVESYDGGSHIGLMQMPSTVPHAWDWLVNTQDAATLFREKLRIAASLERRTIQAHRGLRRLTAVESENMALVLYGPHAAAGLDNQYYRAVQRADGSHDWVVNTANNPGGVSYANDIRTRMH